MSRCFPYPPPGYVLPEKRQPLIDSIKPQKDKEKAKEERRKERKREKKDKKRKCEVWFGQEKLVNEKSQKLEKQTLNLKGNYVKSQGDDVSSDVTNEHEQPICVAKPSYSSEDSQNSDKRRRHESSANTIQCTGSVLKIRLSSLNKKEDRSSSKKVEPDVASHLPSTSGRVYPIGQSDFGFGRRLVNGHPSHSKTSVEDFVLPSASPVEKRSILLQTQKHKDVPVTKTSTSKASKVELLYKSLLENWVPPALGDGQRCDGDDEWLCQRKFQNTKRSDTTSKPPCSLDSNLWPHAQFLPSVDIYALPYTVPF